MKTQFIDKKIKYDGTQLKSHFILNEFEIRGDAAISFIGECDVQICHMVDLEDVIAKDFIYSENMLHFIIEIFENDLEKMILKQRLLISQIQEELKSQKPEIIITRNGDDLYHQDKKLTVSIATLSRVSSLIHTGINISSQNTPVKTLGLEDLNISPVNFSKNILKRFQTEMEEVKWAKCKVRGVL